MSRTPKQLAKTTLKKLFDFSERTEPNIFKQFDEIVRKDIKLLKDCAECSVIDFYISEFDKLSNEKHLDPNEEGFFDKLKESTRMKLANKYASSKLFDNNIDTYFNDVKREYILHPMTESDDMQFVPENREVFLKNNLKLVINCAKRYRGLGLEFEDLIQIGNYGLLTAYNKFDADRANLRGDILNDVKNFKTESFTYEESIQIIKNNFKYAKLLDSTLKKIPDNGFSTKSEFYEWVENNIKKASFASISFIWIRAAILFELNKFSKIIYVPKSNKEEENTSVNIIRLDDINPHTDDEYHDNQISGVANEEFIIEDEKIENNEKQEMFHEMIDKLMVKLSQQERRIIKKRFGIGTPFSLSISEIAESEGLNHSKVKYIISNSMKIICQNASPYDKKTITELLY